MKKYNVNWNASPSSYGIAHNQKCDTIQQVIYEIEEYWNKYQAVVSVYDNVLDDYVFLKNIGSCTPEIDFIFTNYSRDLRTTTRNRKN